MKTAKAALTAKEIALTAIFAALTAVLAQIAVPLPFTPVPLSFGLVAVYISGILLKPVQAVFSQVCYLALGAVGVPVFGNFKGGIGALFGPTGGYLIVYPVMALIVAAALNSRSRLNAGRGKRPPFLIAAAAMCAAHIVLYIGGTAWLSVTTNVSFYAALGAAVVPFIPLDAVKIAFCVIAIVPFRSRLMASGMLMPGDGE